MRLERFVSVVAPIRDDSDILETFIQEIIPILQDNFQNYELVLVDDGSQDDSVATIRELLGRYPGIRLVQLSRSFGEEVAITAGLESVIGDFVVVMLPFMDPPGLIRPIVEQSLAGSDVVFGVLSGPRPEGRLYRAGSWVFHAYCERFLGINLPRNSTQFRCLSRRALNAITRSKDIHRYLRLFSYYLGYPHQEFPYVPALRGHRRQPHSFVAGVNMAIDFIVENSRHPLRFVTWTGILAALINFIYITIVIIIYAYKRFDTKGWASLSLQSAGQFLFLALMLTIMSEYVGRILERLRDRPFYYVMDELASTVSPVEQDRYNIVLDSRE
jgi:glycosyltransferase involved in cell wall biosynthesis